MPLDECADCGVTIFARCKDDLCGDCYVPNNPTWGWCLSRLRKMGHPVPSGTDTQIKQQVYAILGMNRKGRWKNDEGRKAQTLESRVYRGDNQGEDSNDR